MIGLKKSGRKPPICFATSFGLRETGVPFDGPLTHYKRRVAERFGSAGKNEIGRTVANITIGRIDRLHAGATIDLYGEGDHRVAHAKPQGRDTSRVHFVGDDVDATENDLIKGVRRKGLAHQKRATALHR